MSEHGYRGLTLVELIVVIVIIGTLFCFILPAVHGPRIAARGNTCRNNLAQLSKALAYRESTLGEYPGYINSLGPPEAERVRASWAVMTLPYIDQQKLWEQWNDGSYAFDEIDIFICPSDPPVEPGKSDLSYVANAGCISNAAGSENRANGIFFDRTRKAAGASGPEDERDLAGDPEIVVSTAFLSQHDGASRTLLLSENIQAFYWGFTSIDDRTTTMDRKYHFGFCWEQPGIAKEASKSNSPAKVRRINGTREYGDLTTFKQMAPSDGFPSSNHPGGVNVAFAGGSVQFISDQIDPLVYAQLMTSDCSQSDLRNAAGKPDEILTPPDDDY